MKERPSVSPILPSGMQKDKLKDVRCGGHWKRKIQTKNVRTLFGLQICRFGETHAGKVPNHLSTVREITSKVCLTSSESKAWPRTAKNGTRNASRHDTISSRHSSSIQILSLVRNPVGKCSKRWGPRCNSLWSTSLQNVTYIRRHAHYIVHLLRWTW